DVAKVKLTIESRLVPFGKDGNWPRLDNQFITSHSFPADKFIQSHYETGGGWAFNIMLTTSNGPVYAEALKRTIDALDKHWPDHPTVDVLYHDNAPPERSRVVNLG